MEQDEDDAISIDCRINSLEPEVPGRANPRMLERAVYNLLQNAVRHCRQRIHVTLETADNHCLIHVDDDGTGVAESDRRKIFEPFVQLETAEKAEAYGYGRTTKRCWQPLQRHWSVENQSSLKKRPDLTNKAAQL